MTRIGFKQQLQSLGIILLAMGFSIQTAEAKSIFMVCETNAMDQKRVANGATFHAEIDLNRNQLSWNGFKSYKLEVTEGRFFSYLNCDNSNGACMRPFLMIDRYTGKFEYQPWSDLGEYSGTCKLAEKGKKLF